VAAVSAAPKDRQLVLDQFTAAASEDGRTVGEARSRLLAVASREPSDAAVVWEHGAAICGAAAASGVKIGVLAGGRLEEGGGTCRGSR